MLRNVSDPKSKHYGQYLSLAAIEHTFGPLNSSVNTVTSWLESSGARDIVRDNNDLVFSVSVSAANAMLDADFKTYTKGAQEKVRTTRYSIPDHLADHVDLISPTTYFDEVKSQAFLPTRRNVEPSQPHLNHSCFHILPQVQADNSTINLPTITPQCLQELYNMTGYTPDRHSGSNAAFVAFMGQSALFDDMKQFLNLVHLPQYNFTTTSINNGSAPVSQDPDTTFSDEADLDAQMIVSLSGGLPVHEYYVAGQGPFVPDALYPNETYNYNEPFLKYFQYLLALPEDELQWVLSTSWADIENNVPEAYARRVCNTIGLLGLRGRTVVASSGDMGVGELCLSNDQDGKPNRPQFDSQFPANCPWVTTVGGTQNYNPAAAWNMSSGGFSYYFDRPWYQQNAVETYLNDHLPKATRQYYRTHNYTNFAGRGFPDISAHSEEPYYLVVVDGEPQFSGGTSAAAPVISAVLTLLNDVRFRAKQPAIGFANPWLYSIGVQGINDITAGRAVGCEGPFGNPMTGENVTTAPLIPYATWNATKGWGKSSSKPVSARPYVTVRRPQTVFGFSITD